MIEIKQLTKKYTDKVAVDNLTLDIHSGVVTGFLGPNGAGKSTTMRMILGLIDPTKGYVFIDKKPYCKLDNPINKIGALIDADAVNPRFSARQHLTFMATAANLSKARVEEMIFLTGLEKAGDKPIKEYSFGMRQRLGIAGALIGDPDTIILDEPFNGLDVDGIKWLRKLTMDLALRGKAVLVSSHLMGEVQEIAGRVIVLARGQLIADMDMKEMNQRSLSGYVQVKTNRAQELRRALESKGADVISNGKDDIQVRNMEIKKIGEIAFVNNIPLYELSKYQPTLEQLYTELTKGREDYSSNNTKKKREEK
ncbi:ABC-2 type transport system ATP-binding protein [Mobilisporobacter senegalensis]|uniref:ABC-2 type transport system ATP-binding protein n=1 Tax=Mobilisporobacter senegalensis TaxID=1329262 RepID=A0A3N1XKL1_9FIRM|nr:ATP-binding cassette domain-containing protein [Mobilisporobacter senegalensis]ROR27243.1 ABC-2 type transport system ATP-binding protein [Mobilisporobacter senegalensis]